MYDINQYLNDLDRTCDRFATIESDDAFRSDDMVPRYWETDDGKADIADQKRADAAERRKNG